MNMYVALSVGSGMLRLKNKHLVKLLGALRAVLKHGSHGCIAVYICVFSLGIVILGFFEGKILICLHQPCVHLSYSGTLSSVKDEFLCGSGMTVFYEHLLYGILYLLYGRHLIMTYLYQIYLYLSGQKSRHIIIFSP